MSRKQSREQAFRLLYQLGHNQNKCVVTPEAFSLLIDDDFAKANVATNTVANASVKLTAAPSGDPESDSVKIDAIEFAYITTLCGHVQTNLDAIDAHIERLSTGFRTNRIFPIDMTIIRMGIAEILFMDTPPQVVADQCVEIANKYSTEKSFSFINGILATLIKEQYKEQPNGE